MSHEVQKMPVHRLTEGPQHHFFGYYDKCPWSRDGRYVLAMRSPFMDRNPTLRDPLTIGVIDRQASDRFTAVGQTLAWNWQQGCMLRWLPHTEQGRLIYNDLREHGYVSVVHDLASGASQDFPYPLYDIAPHGRTAATLTFERITDTRPGYGYFGRPDPFAEQRQPDEDGLYLVDMERPTRRLAFSIAEAAGFGQRRPGAEDKAWFNHIKFNPSGTRLTFLHRWAKQAVPGHRGFQTRMFTIGVDGSDPRCLVEGCGVSHFDWYDDTHLVAWLFQWNADESQTGRYAMIEDITGRQRTVGPGLFDCDGHCNFSPDRRWMLTDTYPRGANREQTLILYDLEAQRRVDVGAFAAEPVENPSWRCDLHPRWNREGSRVCIDSTHEGTRQMYVVDVSAVTRA